MSKTPSMRLPESVLESRWARWLPNLLVAFFVIVALLLPPVSLGKRLTTRMSTPMTGQGWTVADPDGTELTILPVGLPEGTKLTPELTGIPRAELEAGDEEERYQALFDALPSHLAIKSPLYWMSVRGAEPEVSILRIPVPNDAEPWYTLDVYGWSGEEWYRLDGHLIEAKEVIQVEMEGLPQAAAVVQTQGSDLVWSAPLSAEPSLSAELRGALDEVHPFGGLVADDGGLLVGSLPSEEAFSVARVMPTVRNWTESGQIWYGRVGRIIGDEALRQAHVGVLRQFVVEGGFDGLDVDYRGLDAQLHPLFTQFIVDLAEALHGEGKLLSVRVSLPSRITADQWDTGVYDWPALSRAVDILRAPVPVDPRAYRAGGAAESYLRWAVGAVDRYKLQLVALPQAATQVGSETALLPYGDALALLVGLAPDGVPDRVGLGDQVALEMSHLRRSSGLLYDEALRTWWFSFLDDHRQQHAVWLNNAEGLAFRADLAGRFHVRGISVEGLGEPKSDPNLGAAMLAVIEGTDPPVAERFDFRWQIDGPASLTSQEKSLAAENAFYTWQAPLAGGTYEVSVVVDQDGQAVAAVEPVLVQVGTAVAEVASTPTPVPTEIVPTPTPTPVPPTPTPTSTPVPPTPTPVVPTATPTPTPTSAPTQRPPTATPTPIPPTPTPSLQPAPVLLEPESGARFPKEVRLKWTWPRKLQEFEKFAVRWEPVGGPEMGDWWVDEAGILGGGGAVQEVEGGFRYEVNFGLSAYPLGEATWSVAVYAEKSIEEKWQVSEWSEKRPIIHGSR